MIVSGFPRHELHNATKCCPTRISDWSEWVSARSKWSIRATSGSRAWKCREHQRYFDDLVTRNLVTARSVQLHCAAGTLFCGTESHAQFQRILRRRTRLRKRIHLRTWQLRQPCGVWRMDLLYVQRPDTTTWSRSLEYLQHFPYFRSLVECFGAFGTDRVYGHQNKRCRRFVSLTITVVYT